MGSADTVTDHADTDLAHSDHADSADLPSTPPPAAPVHPFPDDVVAAIGKASEALEYVERARGRLYDFHQLMGRADIEFGNAVDMLREAGLTDDAERLGTEIVGRNVIDGRWTFQVVDEFDDLYHAPAAEAVRALERQHLGGRRHLYEAGLKRDRRTEGLAEHASRPSSGESNVVQTSEAYDS